MMGILVNFLVMLGFFWRVDWRISLSMMVVFTVNFLVARKLITNNIKARRALNKVDDDISAIIVDNMMNYETVKLFAREQQEYDRMAEKMVAWVKGIWDYAHTFR